MIHQKHICYICNDITVKDDLCTVCGWEHPNRIFNEGTKFKQRIQNLN